MLPKPQTEAFRWEWCFWEAARGGHLEEARGEWGCALAAIREHGGCCRYWEGAKALWGLRETEAASLPSLTLAPDSWGACVCCQLRWRGLRVLGLLPCLHPAGPPPLPTKVHWAAHATGCCMGGWTSPVSSVLICFPWRPAPHAWGGLLGPPGPALCAASQILKLGAVSCWTWCVLWRDASVAQPSQMPFLGGPQDAWGGPHLLRREFRSGGLWVFPSL